MKIVKKVCMVLLALASIWNIYKIIDCYTWIHSPTTEWSGGLGKAEFYVGFGTVALLLQVVNVAWMTRTFIKEKSEKKMNRNITISIIIWIVSYFIPIYGFYLLYPYNNLYEHPIWYDFMSSFHN